MHTLTEMLAQVRRNLNDAEASQYSDPVLTDHLVAAAETVANDLADDPLGKRALRTYSTWTDLAANTEVYDLPADCLLLEGVEFRASETEPHYRNVPFLAPGEGGCGVRSGTAAIFGDGAACTSCSAPLNWCDDVDNGSIRLWPASTGGSGQYRFRYAAAPVFPSAAAGTFNDPAASGTPTRKIPDGYSWLVIYYATALAATEELENGTPIGTYGALYRGKKKEYVRAAGGGAARPSRRFVNFTRSG